MKTSYLSYDPALDDLLSGRLDAADEQELLARYLGDPGRLERLRQFLSDREVPERFIRDELSKPERRAYEVICLADPESFVDLEVLERSQGALRALDAAGALPIARPRRGWLGALQSPQYAMAASVLLVASLIVTGLVYRENLALRAGGDAAGAYASTRLVPILTLRGGPQVTVPAPADDEWTVLLVDPGRTDYDQYRITMSRDGGEPIARLDELTLTYDLRLPIGLPGRALVPGDYAIVIEGRFERAPADAGYEGITTVPLRITPRP